MNAQLRTISLFVSLVGALPAYAQTPAPWKPLVGDFTVYVIPIVYTDQGLGNDGQRALETMADVADSYYKNSFGQMRITPRLVSDPSQDKGLVHIPFSCAEMRRLLNDSADEPFVYKEFKRLTGIDPQTLDPWSNKIVQVQRCLPGGSASLSSAYRASLLVKISRSQDASLIAHELGHSMGMAHASGFRIAPADIGEYWGKAEYRDKSTFMGKGKFSGGVNAPHRVQMGWLTDANMSTITGPSQTFTLQDLDTLPAGGLPSSGTLAIKIPRNGAPADSPFLRDYYFVSLRQGALFIHGVERSPYDTKGTQFVWGNTVLFARTMKPLYVNRDNAFQLTTTPLSASSSSVEVKMLP